MITRRQVLLGAAAVFGVSIAASTITRLTEEKRIASLVPVDGLMDRYTWTQHVMGFGINKETADAHYDANGRGRITRDTLRAQQKEGDETMSRLRRVRHHPQLTDRDTWWPMP